MSDLGSISDELLGMRLRVSAIPESDANATADMDKSGPQDNSCRADVLTMPTESDLPLNFHPGPIREADIPSIQLVSLFSLAPLSFRVIPGGQRLEVGNKAEPLLRVR